MTDSENLYDKIPELIKRSGKQAAIERLVQHFREREQYPELFEALKMQIRSNLGLPLLYGESTDEVGETRQRALEDNLLEACREVGTALVQQGKIEQGWMYLQPISDRNFLEGLFSSVEVTDENCELLIQICLGQAIAPELGYSLVLKNHGTCNSITVFDSQCHAFPRSIRSRLAGQLVDHIYHELRDNVRRHIQENEPGANLDPDATLAELILDRDWLFAGGGHHLDVTHLASAVRIGRFCEQGAHNQQALELCQYGAKLADDFQFPGDPPFEENYPDHLCFYQALLDIERNANLEHFRTKALAEPVEQVGTAPLESVIDLLSRVGRRREAIQLSLDHLPGLMPQMGIAPRAFEVAKSNDDFEILRKHYRQANDLLGFATAALLPDDAPIQVDSADD